MDFSDQPRQSWWGHLPILIALSLVLITENVVGVDVVEWLVLRA
jgi:hypothetical protein